MVIACLLDSVAVYVPGFSRFATGTILLDMATHSFAEDVAFRTAWKLIYPVGAAVGAAVDPPPAIAGTTMALFVRVVMAGGSTVLAVTVVVASIGVVVLTPRYATAIQAPAVPDDLTITVESGVEPISLTAAL
jgi:hypothetical protein